jgi:hypothetical protein
MLFWDLIDNFFILSNINWEKIIDLLFRIDWILVIKIFLWVGIPYFFLWFFSFLYVFLRSKIWWDREFFLYKIEHQMKKGIPITYNEHDDTYNMEYKGFYFVNFIFKKIDNDCRITIVGDRTWIWFSLFEDSEINLNLDKEFDYKFYQKLINYCNYIPSKNEFNYEISWIDKIITEYGSYKGR